MSKSSSQPQFYLPWLTRNEIASLVFELVPKHDATLFAQYTIGLHAWFLDQVRQLDARLSKYLHDGQSEKPFTISSLEGEIERVGNQIRLNSQKTYRWYVTGLSSRVTDWLQAWIEGNIPSILELNRAPLEIKSVAFALPPTTYKLLWSSTPNKNITLSFITPTSFRHKGHHFPLPVPTNLFQSYLRRWNDFSKYQFAQDEFLAWVNEYVVIRRHKLESVKVAAGKKGSVTGFIGAVELSVSNKGVEFGDYYQLYWTLGQLASYCGTGHKTTFGLGQTRLGWLTEIESVEAFSLEHSLAKRIEELTELLMKPQKRTGGTRAIDVCQKRATILARKEFGESLGSIASDLDMPYQTVKSYVKLARQIISS